MDNRLKVPESADIIPVLDVASQVRTQSGVKSGTCSGCWRALAEPMARKERVRETMTSLPTLEHLVERVEKGWKLGAIEWEREAASAPAPAPGGEKVFGDIPCGL